VIGALKRLTRMPREELTWRAMAQSRIERQRLMYLVRKPRWQRSDIEQILSPGVLTPEVRHSIRQGDWSAVDRLLHEQLATRPSRYVLEPRDASALVAEITTRWPEAAGDAARRADRILAGTYDFLGYRGVHCEDWHGDAVNGRRMPERFWASVPYLDPQHGDHKVIWEFNRHQHWLTLGRAYWLTGNPRYADAIVHQLQSWLSANPPLTGVNWASMLELGFRSLTWLWAIHILQTRPPGQGVLVDLLVGLDRQMVHVADNLSHYFSPNTHLTGEALALYVVGNALPELARSGAWVETGRRVLLSEMDRQVSPDGGHVERSTHYQRYTLDFYLLALATAEIAEDRRALLPLRAVCARLAACTRTLADNEGRLPMIGDDDGGMLWPIAGREARDVRDSLAVAAALLDQPALAASGDIPEECWWIAGIERSKTAEAASAHAVAPVDGLHASLFEQTGYAVMRCGGDHLIFDVGRHGYLNGGHAHADALAVTLSIDGRPLLIDPGTITYTMDAPLRDRMRSSVSHNTLTLDNRSSSIPSGPFHWQRHADARLEAWRANPGCAWAEAAHDGYAPVQHRRTVVGSVGAGWLIFDEVLGAGRHRADLHWHIDPAWMVEADDGHRLRLTTGDGHTAWLVHEAADVSLIFGEATGLGWCSTAYGARVPTTTARMTTQAAAPFTRASWVGGGDQVPTLERVRVECDALSGAVGLRLRRGNRRWTTLLRPGEGVDREERSCSSAEYHSDARLVQYGATAGALTSLSLADVSHALALQDGLISVASEVRVPDLHLTVGYETVDIVSTSPPPSLRLHGARLATVKRVRLNGREQRPTGEAIELFSSDWAVCAESPALSV
jgi:uncharacterized heparinase superfamily protein